MLRPWLRRAIGPIGLAPGAALLTLAAVSASGIAWLSDPGTAAIRKPTPSDATVSTSTSVTNSSQFAGIAHPCRVGQAHVDDLAAEDAAPQPERRIHRQDVPDPHNGHVVAVGRLAHDLCGDEQRAPLVAQLAKVFPASPAQHRVDPGGRLVGEQQPRVVHAHPGEHQAALHAAGERGRAPRSDRRRRAVRSAACGSRRGASRRARRRTRRSGRPSDSGKARTAAGWSRSAGGRRGERRWARARTRAARRTGGAAGRAPGGW
jgi:hypothetical protein